jgi:hypothetical protein
MASNHKLRPSQSPPSRLQLTGAILLRSGAIGLISGSLLGALFGSTPLPWSFWTGSAGAKLGLGLGLVGGLVLSALTCLFFYPYKHPRVYPVLVKTTSALLAGSGAALFGPWYFSSSRMTPNSAVFIGFSSVLASVIAGGAGSLVGHHLAQWYKQASTVNLPESTTDQTNPPQAAPNTLKTWIATVFLSEKLGWISLALLALFGPVPGYWLLKFLVCGDVNANAYDCLPSPRLYTSVPAGFKALFPIVLLWILAIVLLQNRHRRPR